MSNCVTRSNNQACLTPTNWSLCKPWDLSQQTKSNCYADALAAEAVAIAGAPINIYKMLGVHEQTKLLDLTDNGLSISGGDAPGYPAKNAFVSTTTIWKSKQSGPAAITMSAYIGYDFGVQKLPNGRQRYGIEANIRQHVTSIRIKQSSLATERATKVRVERSENGTEWYGVSVLTLPDDDKLNTLHFKQSSPSRWWRLRPLQFNGAGCDSWSVQALELHDYAATAVNNIQDPILLENRDREYQQPPVFMKGYYDLITVVTDLSRFGIEIPMSSYQIKIHFNSCITTIGRPIVVGDIIELPSEVQYTPDLKPIKRYLEVTDVTWDASSYTPGWMPIFLSVKVEPAMASQETRDIFGDLAQHVDSSGLFDTGDGNHTMYQDISAIDQTIRAESNTLVPERGSEGSNTVREFTEEEKVTNALKNPHINKIGFHRTGLYVEDAMPQNGDPYTEGATFPTSPKDGEYHRMTYEGLADDVPPRLYRYSTKKGRWLYLETDKRSQYNAQKAVLEEYTTNLHKKSATKIR